MVHMFQDQFHNPVQKVSTMKHALQELSLAHFRMLVHELFNEDTDMVPKEAPLIVLDRKCAMCMAKNGKDTKHTRHIARRMHFVRNGEKCKMQKIKWCEGGLQ